MTFVHAWGVETGIHQLVPEHFFDDPVLSRGLTQTPPEVDQAPDETWTVDQLKQHAADHDIDLTGLKVKGDILAAITAHTPQPPANGEIEE